MSVLKQEAAPEFTDRDVALGVALACGVSLRDAGAAVGITERWMWEHKERYGALAQRVADIIAPLVKSKREIRQIAKAQVNDEMEKLLGDAVEVYRTAVQANDITLAMQAADRIINRVCGKETTRLQIGGAVAHYALPPSVVEALMLDAAADADLHGRARQLTGVIDTPALDGDAGN